MKIREGYVLNEIADTTVAIYVGEDQENGLKGIVQFNELGTLLWQKLEAGYTKEDLVKAVTDEYDIDEVTAAADIEAFLDSLRAENIIEEA